MYYYAIILCSLFALIGIALYYRSKNKTVEQICNHPELSDEKVKAIANMMTTEHKGVPAP